MFPAGRRPKSKCKPDLVADQLKTVFVGGQRLRFIMIETKGYRHTQANAFVKAAGREYLSLPFEFVLLIVKRRVASNDFAKMRVELALRWGLLRLGVGLDKPNAPNARAEFNATHRRLAGI